LKKLIYLKICESYRDKGKVRQRVVANPGRLDILQEHGLENIVNDLAKFISRKNLIYCNMANYSLPGVKDRKINLFILFYNQ
jgi:hypothetical protein